MQGIKKTAVAWTAWKGLFFTGLLLGSMSILLRVIPVELEASSITGTTWTKYSLVAIANGVNGCANANGCWQVNGVLGANKAAGLTQSVVLFAKPANGFVEVARIKTALAFSGTTTATGTLGTTTDDNFYTTALYDLMGAVNVTNYGPANGLMQGAGGTTTAAENVVLAIITTVANIDQIAANSAVDVWVKMTVLP